MIPHDQPTRQNGMCRIKSLQRGKQGFVLLMLLGFTLLSIGLVVSILPFSSTHGKIARKQMDMESAMYVAEGGLEQACQYTQLNIYYLMNCANSVTSGSGSLGAGAYAYAITRINPNLFSIASTGTVNNVSRVISLQRIYQPTFAKYALWSHQNGAIYFKPGDTFWGHVHADDAFYFSVSGGAPVFHDQCTTLTNIWYTDNATKNGDISAVQFDYGFALNSYQGAMTNVDFNSTSSNSLKSVAQSLGLVLSGNSTITFSANTVKITNPAQGWTNYVYTPNLTNGLIYVANRAGATSGTNAGIVYLNGGVVSNRLTIVAENDFYVRSNITYSVDPRSNTNSICALGLITMDDVNVDTSAPNNLEIDAVVLCTGTSGDGSAGSFGVVNYNQGSPRGNLTVYGGIVQNVRGAVGTLGSPGTGFTKNYSFDPRFAANPPPYYPVVIGLVIFANWQEGPKQ